MSDVVLEGVRKAFGPVTVLRGVDLNVPNGDLGVLLGPSGCGKSTLLRILAGHLAPDAGTVRIGGRLMAGPTVHVPPEARGISIVPQDGALFPHLDVAGNVAFGLPGRPGGRSAGRRGFAFGRRGRRTHPRVREVLELVGLPGYESAHPAELSGGQQQRVALARALAPEPALVLLDEPFSALDASLRVSVRADVRRVLRESGATALLVTHDQEEALSIADSVAVLQDGRIAMHGPPGVVYRRPSTLAVARFIGDIVELPVGSDGSTVVGPLPAGTTVPAGARVVAVRPEDLDVTRSGGAPGVGASAVVRQVEYFGHDALVRLEVLAQVAGAGSAGAGSAGAGSAGQVVARTTWQPRVGERVEVRIAGPVIWSGDDGARRVAR